ncbi:MAG: hypothetical protein O3A65_04875 [Proteobacteria bacterium]|nr:hypothetical protein [Pseudomonadota bacterium]
MLIVFMGNYIDPVNAGKFRGAPVIEQIDTLEHSQYVKLIRGIDYVDNQGDIWTTEENLLIPLDLLSDEIRQIRPLPREFDYLKTTLIYHSQSVQATKPWRAVQSIVYEALIDEGLQEHIAKMIYAIVRAEGWRWEPLGSTCYKSCHSAAPLLRWRAMPNYAQLNATLDWILLDFPTIDQINKRVDALILKTGPHIFAQ